MTKEEQNLQTAIDKHRSEGVDIKVNYSPTYPETVISVAFSYNYDAMEKAADIASHLEEGYDSGAGCGYRDLQLCRVLNVT